MQRVVIRGPRSEGGARRRLLRLAGAKAPTRLARTPGHANRTAVTRRPTRPVMEIGDTDSGRISQHRAPAEPAPCSPSPFPLASRSVVDQGSALIRGDFPGGP
jgi:hypothetical protein